MKPQAKDLALAILTRIEEREGTANKTKLLKLLYLADIENFRATGQTLTGFDWIFYMYGPWSSEYDRLLEQLQAEGAVDVEKWATTGVEGERITAKERVPLKKLQLPTEAFFRTRRQVDTWADRGVSRLLDYVYFETEPMDGAEKMQPLDFSKVPKQAPQLYRRTSSGTEPSALKRLRRKILEFTHPQGGGGAVRREGGRLALGAVHSSLHAENTEAGSIRRRSKSACSPGSVWGSEESRRWAICGGKPGPGAGE